MADRLAAVDHWDNDLYVERYSRPANFARERPRYEDSSKPGPSSVNLNMHR